MIFEIRLRNGNAEEWVSKNPILSRGEPGFENDTKKLKVGDGITNWVDLEYTASSGSGIDENDILNLLQSHINAEEPHSTYDDIPSLTLLFENGLI